LISKDIFDDVKDAFDDDLASPAPEANLIFLKSERERTAKKQAELDAAGEKVVLSYVDEYGEIYLNMSETLILLGAKRDENGEVDQDGRRFEKAMEKLEGLPYYWDDRPEFGSLD